MSERIPNTGGDDAFNRLIADLTTDKDFNKTVAGLDDDMDRADFATLSGDHAAAFEQYGLPHTEQPLDEVVHKITDAFQRICKEHSVDPNTTESSAEEYVAISKELAIAMYRLKKELWPGDIITATDALVVDMAGDDNTMDVLGLFGGDRVIGTFCTPIVGPMPDETHAIMLGDAIEPAMGVGLMIENPIVIDGHNEVHTDAFRGDRVIISLDVLGNKLAKYVFPTAS